MAIVTALVTAMTAARDWIADNEIMIIVIGLVLAVFCLVMGVRPAFRERDYPIESFDMTIRHTLDHLHEVKPHGHEGSGSSNRDFLNRLHKLMCIGVLPVMGTPEGSVVSERISASKCRELTSLEQVVPINTATPEGVRFLLIKYEDKNWLDSWDGVTQPVALEQYSDLLLRSADVYRIRPRTIA